MIENAIEQFELRESIFIRWPFRCSPSDSSTILTHTLRVIEAVPVFILQLLRIIIS